MRRLLPALLALSLLAAGCQNRDTSPVDPKARAEGLYIHATALYLKGEFDQSLKAYQELQKLRPDDPRLPAAFGELYLSQGKLHEALEQFQRAAKNEPKRSTNWSRIGFIQAQLGQTEVARSALLKAIALNPRDFNGLEALADLEFKAGNLDGAVKDLQLSADASPTAEQAADLRVRAATALDKAGRRPEAIRILQSAAGAGDATPALNTALGDLLIRQGDFEGALSAYRTAARHAPHDPTLWELVGELELRLDKPGDAMQAFRESLKIKNRAVVHVELARLQRSRNELGAAKDELQSALESATGEDPHESLELARLLDEFDRPKDALALLEELSAEPDQAKNPELQVETARLAKKVGDPAVVQAACARALKAGGKITRCP